MLRAATTRSLNPGASRSITAVTAPVWSAVDPRVRERTSRMVDILVRQPVSDQPREVKPPRSSAGRRGARGYLAFGMYHLGARIPAQMECRDGRQSRIGQECRRTARNRPSRPRAPRNSGAEHGHIGPAIGCRRSPVARGCGVVNDHREVAPTSTPVCNSPPWAREVRDQGVGDRLAATDRHRPADQSGRALPTSAPRPPRPGMACVKSYARQPTEEPGRLRPAGRPRRTACASIRAAT